MNVDQSEEDVANALLDLLHASYHTATLVLKHYHSKLTMAKVRESLTYEEIYFKKGNAFLSQETMKADIDKPTYQ